MVTYILDGAKMTTPALAHRHIAEALGLPEGLSPDPDGLWEGLCQLPVPCHLSIVRWARAARALEDHADELLEVFCDLVEEEPGFTFDMTD